MTTLRRYRPRFLRDWAKDALIGFFIFIVLPIAGMWAPARMADACTAIGFCIDSTERTAP